MNVLAHKSMRLPFRLWLSVGIAAVLFAAAAVAVSPLSASIQTSAGSSRNIVAPGDAPEALPPAAIVAPERLPANRTGKTRAKAKCTQCGVIESMRKIEAPDETSRDNASHRITADNRREIEIDSVQHYEITIRLRDGSRHVINDMNSAKWRPGERVNFIGGME